MIKENQFQTNPFYQYKNQYQKCLEKTNRIRLYVKPKVRSTPI